jgi:hypothetical protein
MIAQSAGNPARLNFPVATVLALWLALVFLLGAEGAFVQRPGEPPLSLLIGFTAPLLVFLAAFWGVRAFHDYVMTMDLRLAAGIQAWRFAGLGFLALYTYGVLPGAFAWPAGLGDIAIGITAPWMMLALIRRPGFAASPLFMVWNLLGILDLVVAMSTGALLSFLAAGNAGQVTTAPMAQMPLVLIPVYFVPLFLMLHITSLLQLRQKKMAEQSGDHAVQRSAA